MGLENFILTCEKDNELLRKDIDYYKNYNKRLEKQNKELKEKLEQCSAVADTNSELADRIDEHYKSQQKEFIEYLENKLNMCDAFLDTIKSDLEEISYAGRVSGKTYIETQIMKNEIAMKCYEEALSKYKEIIGGKHE